MIGLIKEHGTIFESKKRHFCYFSKIGDLLYFKDFMKESFHVKDKSGIHLVTKDKCLSHNFSPRKFGDRYWSLAGQDRWKMMLKWRGLNYEEFCHVYKIHWGREYAGSEKKYEIVRERFSNTESSRFADGLYLMHSQDGISWCPQVKTPVIMSKHKGFNSSLSWKSGEFDSPISLNYFDGKYWMYIRDNIAKDRRTVQYSTSDDLINWSAFNRVNLPFNIEFDNYYYIEVFEYDNRFFAFSPFYTDFYCCIRFLVSDDGVNFNTVSDLFKSVPVVVEFEKRKNRDHIVGGVGQDDENIYFYVHHNYLGYDRNAEVTVNKYSISKRYLECL